MMYLWKVIEKGDGRLIFNHFLLSTIKSWMWNRAAIWRWGGSGESVGKRVKKKIQKINKN